MAKRNQPRRQRAQNSFRRDSGLGTPPYDFGTLNLPARMVFTPLQQDQFCVRLYHTDWAAKKIVSIPVDDMLRDAWSITGIPDDVAARLMDATQRFNVLNVVRQALRLERLVGGAAIYLGVSDGQSDPSIPLNDDSIQRGGLKFLNCIPRSRVTQIDWNQDPLSPLYGRPEHYYINGQRVHRSRLVIFDGDPLLPVPDNNIAPIEWIRRDGFGQSVLLTVFDDLTRATGSRQAAYQMVQRASVFIAEMDLEGLGGTEAGQQAIAQMSAIVNQINAFRGAVIDRQPGATSPAISTVATQFGSVPELTMSFLQVLSAASDIPATRFLGQAPGGLNATGESDLENYYGRLESDRTNRLEPQLMRITKLLSLSEFGQVLPDMDLEFRPLWSLSEVEEAGVRKANIDNVNALVDRGMLTDEEGLEELLARDVLMVTPSGDDLGKYEMQQQAQALEASLQGIAGGGDPPQA